MEKLSATVRKLLESKRLLRGIRVIMRKIFKYFLSH